MTIEMGMSSNYAITMGLASLVGMVLARFAQSRLPASISANANPRYWHFAPLYGFCTGSAAMMGTIIVYGLDGADSVSLAFQGVIAAAVVGLSTLNFMFVMVSRNTPARSKIIDISKRWVVRSVILIIGAAITFLNLHQLNISDPDSIRQLQWPVMYFGAMIPFIMGRYFVWFATWFG